MLPDGVSNIMWRPTFRTHLAVTYSKIPVVHVWDLMQHTSPLSSLCGHNKPVADLVWQDAHILSRKDNASDDVCWVFSCSEDGCVQRQHMCNGYHPFRHQRNASFSIDARGEVLSAVSAVERDQEQVRDRRRTQLEFRKGSAVLYVFPVSGAGRCSRRLRPGLMASGSADLSSAIVQADHARDGGGAIPGGLRKRDGGNVGVGEGAVELDTLMRLAAQYKFESPAASTPTTTVREEEGEVAALQRRVALCQDNHRVCRQAGLKEHVLVWSLLKTLFDLRCATQAREKVAPAGARAHSSSVLAPPPAGLTAMSPHLSPHMTSGVSRAVRRHPPAMSLNGAPHVVGPLVRDVLHRLSLDGDVVTCSVMALVLGKDMLERIGITRPQVLAWFEAFFSLLMRFRL